MEAELLLAISRLVRPVEASRRRVDDCEDSAKLQLTAMMRQFAVTQNEAKAQRSYQKALKRRHK